MTHLINKDVLVSEIERIEHETNYEPFTDEVLEKRFVCRTLLSFINTLEMKEVDLESENENNTSKITVGTKIRSKTNPNVILSIISNDCHEDEFECSNGSVLSLKQIEKYYDIIM